MINITQLYLNNLLTQLLTHHPNYTGRDYKILWGLGGVNSFITLKILYSLKKINFTIIF